MLRVRGREKKDVKSALTDCTWKSEGKIVFYAVCKKNISRVVLVDEEVEKEDVEIEVDLMLTAHFRNFLN